MSQDEFSVVIELDPITVIVDDVPPVDVIVDENEGLKVILSGNTGPPGEQGDVGPQGPPGQDADSSFQYTHNQILASDTWVIVHNLNGYPNVTIVDSAGTTVVGDIVYDSTNQLTVTFTVEFSGSAYLS